MARLFAPQQCSANMTPFFTALPILHPLLHHREATALLLLFHQMHVSKAIHHHVCATVICQRHNLKTFDHTDIVPCQRKGGTVAIYREPSQALLEPGTPALRVNACVT